MSEWRALVRRELARYREEAGTEFVERQEFLKVALPVFEAAFPEANTPGQTFSRVMQELRDRGEVDFVDNSGTYRILDLEDVDASNVADSGVVAGRERGYAAAEYATVAVSRSMPAAFRGYVLDRYGHACPVSGVDHDQLLDVAHVLPWSEYEAYREDPGNVLPLSRVHHAAFDAALFTLDERYRLRVHPEFETESDVLRRTLLDRDGERVDVPDGALDPGHLETHNQALEWW